MLEYMRINIDKNKNQHVEAIAIVKNTDDKQEND